MSKSKHDATRAVSGLQRAAERMVASLTPKERAILDRLKTPPAPAALPEAILVPGRLLEELKDWLGR